MNRTLIALLIAVAPAVLMAQLPDYVPTEGLLAWYNFDGNVEDVSDNLIHYQGASPSYSNDRFSLLSNAIEFDGMGDGMTVPDLGQFHDLSELTLSMWVRFVEYPLFASGEGGHVLFAKTEPVSANANVSFEVLTEYDWNGLRFNTRRSDGVQINLRLEPFSEFLDLNTWHHLVCRYDGTKNQIFWDGELSAESPTLLELGVANNSFDIMTNTEFGNIDHWQGGLDDLGVWSRALNPNEIEALFAWTPFGCTDSSACNYDPEAIEDDGSCLIVDLGEDIETCEDIVALDAGDGFGSYLWSTGETSQTITVSESGLYEATVSAHPANEGSLSFDGDDDWVEAATIDLTGHPFNIEGWIKVPSVSHAHQTNVIDNYVFGSGGSDRWGVYVGGLEDDDMGFEWRGQLYAPTFGIPPTSGGLRIDDNQWHHFAVERGNDGVASIYIDGVLNGIGDCPLAYNLNAGFPTRINGGFHCGGGQQCRFMDCEIAEIKISLTEKYTSDFEPPCQIATSSDAILHYRFGNTNGDTVLDLSGSENHGAIHGASWSEEVPFQDCLSCESSDEILVDFDDCDGYCGEGTVWDEDLQECIALCDDESDDIVCDCPMQPEIDGFVLFGAFEGSFYYYAGDAVSWFEADSISQANSGHLVTIGSQQERDFLNDQLPWDEPTWIGLTQNLMSEEYSEPDGGWEWVTQEPLNYTDWGLNEPNEASSGEDFGMTQRDNGWNDGHPAIVPFEGTPWGFVMEIECCIQGCTNPMACNYQLEANIDDGSCVSCETLASACGEGTVWDPFNQECIVAIPTDTDFDGCVAAGDLLNLLGTFGSCPPIPFSGPCQGQDHVTYQGYDYDIVAIGEQCWFAENLRSESYRNGDEIPYCSNSCQWGVSQEGARSGYGDTYPNTGAPCGQGLGTSGYCFAPTADVVALFGHLYNWYAVMDARELCPSGWSVPSTYDFQDLIELAEGAGEASAEYLKANQTWLQESADSGVLGFKALAGGYGGNLGGFDGDGYLTMFWGTTQSSIVANAEHLQIGAAVDDVFINNNHKQYGQYVRCIKDQ